MSNDCYLSFCPVAKACEVLEPRWTLLVLCELFSGASRFNEIHRGVAGMSPTLLSRRLKEMEKNGLLTRSVKGLRGEITYATTQMAEELRPIVLALGKWAHRNVDRDLTLDNLDARLLMWNVRRKADVALMPPARQWVIQFSFSDQKPGPDQKPGSEPTASPDQKPREDDFWLVVRRGSPTDLCFLDPGQDVDLFIHAQLRAMTSVFLGYTTLTGEVSRGNIQLTGVRQLAASMTDWFVPTVYAAA